MTTKSKRPRTKKNPAAVALGRRGGQVTSPAKAAAARRNGAKGGRPRDLELMADAFRFGVLASNARHLHGAPELNWRGTTFNEIVRPLEEWAKRNLRRARKRAH